MEGPPIVSPCPWQSSKSLSCFWFPWSREQARHPQGLLGALAEHPPTPAHLRLQTVAPSQPPGPEFPPRSAINCSESPTSYPDTGSLSPGPIFTSSPSASPHCSRSSLTGIQDIAAVPRDTNAMTTSLCPKICIHVCVGERWAKKGVM